MQFLYGKRLRMGGEFCGKCTEKPFVVEDLHDPLPIVRWGLLAGPPHTQGLAENVSRRDASTSGLMLEVMEQIFG